jgi:hypothetical protein
MLLSSEDVADETDSGVPFTGLLLTPRFPDLLRLVDNEKIFLKPSMVSYLIA